jgi:hypothetical protein
MRGIERRKHRNEKDRGAENNGMRGIERRKTQNKKGGRIGNEE